MMGVFAYITNLFIFRFTGGDACAIKLVRAECQIYEDFHFGNYVAEGQQMRCNTNFMT